MDEDQGQMSAWLIMVSLGLFQMDGGCSTEPVYEIASPLYAFRVFPFPASELLKGGSLTLEMSSEPNYSWGVE